MTLDMASFVLALAMAALIACAWYYGRASAIRECRRIVRHKGNLDQVFFEDAERDSTIEKPKPATADVREFARESQR